ncbi:HAD-IA family hydrolase [Ferrimonas gelatinilytica]|uniref:5-amino-6-(5-phospho-D-ribitylamino)uracil phosphatase YigB n=1 Tax=Ferrimonas gelatinilytica TaxID=1255257 RepID=A0ABP9RUY3_9GAMM
MPFYRRLQPVRALSFDLDDTLYDNLPVLRRAEQRLGDFLAKAHPTLATVTAEHWQQHKQSVLMERPQLRHCSTEWRRHALSSGLAALGWDEGRAAALADEALEHFLHWRSEIRVPAATLVLLRDLAKRYPLAVISNGNADVARFMTEIPFAAVLRAGPDGPQKPAPDLFWRCCEQLAITPSQLLHVGDHPETDVAGAVAAGCQAIWLNPRPDGRPRPPGTSLPTATIASLEALRLML